MRWSIFAILAGLTVYYVPWRMVRLSSLTLLVLIVALGLGSG